jgi:capsular exopolysaccharide synthesis family protein
MDIHEYLGVLRRGWALVVLGLLVGIAGGFAASAIQPRTYVATSREILTNSEAAGDLTQSLQASNLAEGRIASYVVVATSGLVLQPVIDELKLDMTVQELASHLSVVTPPSTLIVEITATANTPELAKSIANTVSSVFSDVVENQIENATTPAVGATTDSADGATDATGEPAAAPTAPVRIVNIEHASLPTAPALSNAPLLLAVGGILGLALGLVGASLRESLDRRIRGRKDVAAVTELPVLGQIRPDRGVRASPIVMRTSSQSAIAESFRALRASVEHVRSRDDVSTFVVTAVASRQGASLVAANLALAIADTATTVVVVDANLQAPNQAEILGVGTGPGLTDLLTTATGLDEVITAGPGENIWVVPIGSRRASSADVLATSRMRALITQLQGRFDVVIIDAAAISSATDAAVLGSFGAATLLVVAEDTATRPGLAEALAALAAGGSIPAGVVLNKVPRSTRPRSRRIAAPERPAVERVQTRAVPPVVEPVEAPAVASVVEPVETPAVPPVSAPVAHVPAVAVADVAEKKPAEEKPPVIEKVLQIAPPVESTSGRAAARAARVAAKAAARAAASRPQQPVSRFAPKPTAAVEAAESAAAAERRSWPSPVIDSVPVISPVDENSNPVIDVPRGDTGERVSLLAPRPGDPTPDELAEIVANQFKDDVVYEVPVEAFGSFHLVDADAFAAIDNEPTVLPPFRHTEPEVAPGTLVIDPVDPLNTGTNIVVRTPLTEENATVIIDLLADEPVYDQPRFEDWARPAPAAPPAPENSGALEDADQPLAFVEDSADPAGIDETAPEFDASVYDLDDRGTPEPAPFSFDDERAEAAALPEPAVAETAAEPDLEPMVAETAAEPASPEPAPVPETEQDQVGPSPFVAPASWPAPRLVAQWPAAPELRATPEAPPASAEHVVAPATQASTENEVIEETESTPILARVTALPTRERLARESYLLKSRELERAAQERLRYEQERLEARIREQLEADRRQLAGQLDELLEDTVMMPRSVGDGA